MTKQASRLLISANVGSNPPIAMNVNFTLRFVIALLQFNSSHSNCGKPKACVIQKKYVYVPTLPAKKCRIYAGIGGRFTIN
jgi:hypothetical protein